MEKSQKKTSEKMRSKIDTYGKPKVTSFNDLFEKPFFFFFFFAIMFTVFH